MFNPLVLILAKVGEQAAKEKAEASAAKASQDIDQVLPTQKAAEQVSWPAAVTPPEKIWRGFLVVEPDVSRRTATAPTGMALPRSRT
jgi:hypothetical protein